MTTTWTNVLNGAATTVGATPGDAVPATLLADVLQISNSGTGLDTTLRDVGDGDGTTVPLKISTSAVMLPGGVVWPFGDSTFFSAGMTGIMIPYYLYPNNPYSDVTVARLLGLIRQYRGKVPVIVVVNPNSGPGSVNDGNWAAFIRLCQAAGAKVAGYVSTTYSGTIAPFHTEAQVKADIDTWLTLYADTPIDTIFLDEMSYDLGTNNANVALYKRYTDYCHARNLAPVIANPGTNQQGAWFAERTADIIVTAETSTWPTESDLLGGYIGGHIDYKTSLRAALVYGQSTLTPGRLRQLARYVQWVYVTEDALSPNPWDSLSAHLEQTFSILAGKDIISVVDLGAVGDGATDDTAAFQAAAALGRRVYVPSGVYKITSTITVTTAGTIFYGDSIDFTGEVQPYLDTARIDWAGSAGGTMFLFTATSGGGLNNLGGVGMLDIALNGASIAGYGLKIMSVWGGRWRVRCQNHTVASVYTGCVLTLGESATTQANEFVLQIRNISTAGDGVVLTGDGDTGNHTPALYNTSFNRFLWVDVQHSTGRGIVLGDCDTNIFDLARCSGTSTGIAVEFLGHASDNTAVARGNIFKFLNTNKAITARGTTSYTYASRRNSVIYDVGNSTPAPTIETGAKLWYGSDTYGVHFDGGFAKCTMARDLATVEAQRDLLTTETLRLHNGNSNHIRLVTSSAEWSQVISSADLVFARVTGTGKVNLNAPAQVGSLSGGVGFNGTSPVVKTAVTGSRGGNAALASLLTLLASMGLITDSTTV